MFYHVKSLWTGSLRAYFLSGWSKCELDAFVLLPFVMHVMHIQDVYCPDVRIIVPYVSLCVQLSSVDVCSCSRCNLKERPEKKTLFQTVTQKQDFDDHISAALHQTHQSR